MKSFDFPIIPDWCCGGNPLFHTQTILATAPFYPIHGKKEDVDVFYSDINLSVHFVGGQNLELGMFLQKYVGRLIQEVPKAFLGYYTGLCCVSNGCLQWAVCSWLCVQSKALSH